MSTNTCFVATKSNIHLVRVNLIFVLEMEAKRIPVEQFILESREQALVDVRSPGEFLLGHIPGAVNIPLFDDHERAEIGTLYKIKGKQEAVEKGMELVSPKLSGFIRQVKEISPEKKVFVYCWRGGMRSNSFGWLMNTTGLNATVLEGGYKKFRNHVLDFFYKKFDLILIGGPTGGGKSAVLRKLAEAGYQTIDLEKLARHKGSAFGSVNEEKQLPQQHFEHALFTALSRLDQNKPVWMEDEAMAIGWNKIPYPLWLQMKEAPILKLEVPFKIRVQRLVEDYRTTDIELLRKPLLAIGKKLGGQHLKAALEHLDKNELEEVAAIALQYYDEAYEHNHLKRTRQNIFIVETDSGDPSINSEKILKVYRQQVAEPLK